MSNKNIAVIGAGHLGRIHAKLLKTIEGVSPFVVESQQAAREFVESEFQIPTYESLADVATDLDGAIVVTPTQTHYDIASQLIEDGVHVFVEKPICADSRQSRSLCELAERNGMVLQVGHVERFNPAFVAGREHLQQVKFIESTRYTPFTFRATDVSVVLDLMIHDIDLVLSVMKSEVTHVSATGTTTIGPHHDTAVAWLDFASGAKACLKASRVSPDANRSMNCTLDRGQVNINFAAQSVHCMEPVEQVSQQLDALTHDEKMVAKEEMFDKWLPVREIEVVAQNAILEEQKEFVQCIRDEQFPSVSGRDGLAAVEVAEQILAAMGQGQIADKARSAA